MTGNRIKWNHDGSLDEIVLTDVRGFHLEQMHDSGWWIGITRKDGTEDHINIFAKNLRSHVTAIYEADV